MRKDFDKTTAAKSVLYAHKAAKRAYYARKEKRDMIAQATSMSVVSLDEPQRLENGRRMFAIMQTSRTRKHCERGGHDKASMGTVTSVKRFAGTHATCVYKRHKDF